MFVEWLIITAALLGTGFLIVRQSSGRAIGGLVAIVIIAGLGATWGWERSLQRKVQSQEQLTIPHLGRSPEFAGSAACRACHPDQYASWHHSFHRTMTQVASPESVRGQFDNVNLVLDGASYHLERRGDEFWIEMPDPDGPPARELSRTNVSGASHEVALGAARVQRRVSMTTGSHHMQAYWIDNQHGNQQFSLPFTFLFEQNRWVPRRSVFLRDPQAIGWSQVWNVGCIDCHATGGQPLQGKDPTCFESRATELGIACEACHGAAGEHVRLNANPRRRYALHTRQEGDSSIVNPARLSPKRSAEVCGACHSVHAARDGRQWLQEGGTFRPGEELEKKVEVLRHPQSFELRRGAFWSDGMVRVTGREYNGLLKTPCFQKGPMSCLSCHSLHNSSPTNQLAPGMLSNTACLQCHPSFEKTLAQHTHHAPDSSGSLCYNCHMPYTGYGLLNAVRAHQVTSPDATTSLQFGRPNACNLCHLDKTLDWTAQTLATWSHAPPPNLPAEDKTIAASILWALKGDAAQRALIAWHMGWQPAQDASNASWFAPYLAILLRDPYPAVRYIAGRSLQRLPGYATFPYDYIADPDELAQASEHALALWAQNQQRLAPNPALLLDSERHVQTGSVAALLQQRNNRVMELNE